MFWALAILKACPPDTWCLLLDKLSKVPVTSFDDADQYQLYQVYLLLDTAGTFACSGLTERSAWLQHSNVLMGSLQCTRLSNKSSESLSANLCSMIVLTSCTFEFNICLHSAKGVIFTYVLKLLLPRAPV